MTAVILSSEVSSGPPPTGGTTSAAAKPVVYTETTVMMASMSMGGAKLALDRRTMTLASRVSCSGVEMGWVSSRTTASGC